MAFPYKKYGRNRLLSFRRSTAASVANALDSAVQDVFKRCAKRFGIAKKEKNAGHANCGKTQTKVEKFMRCILLGDL